MTRLTLPATIVFSAALFTAAPAAAQTAPEWNRSVEAISIQSIPGGGHEIQAFFKVEASGLTAPTDLSTEMLIHVNGVLINLCLFEFEAGPAAAGGQCQTTQSEVCFSPPGGGTPICICGSFIQNESHETSLQPKDEIIVLLRPAPGAAPENDTSDDMLLKPHTGDTHWNRRIRNVVVQPSKTVGCDCYDVDVDLAFETTYDGPLNLDSEVEVLVNGVSARTFPVPNNFDWSICSGGCSGQSCGSDGGGGNAFCDDTEGCVCSGGGGVFPCPDVPAAPGDEIVVILRPAPGALPELPGFGDDDEEEIPLPTCQADIAGPAGPSPDGNVDALDFLLMISQWGTPCVGSCEADITGPGGVPDGNVDALDFLLMISQWGSPGNCPAPV